MDYVQKLVDLGFLRCCAQRIVNDHMEAGKENDLIQYIAAKEHIAEVLG